MSLVDHAKRELAAKLALPDTEPDRWMADNVVALIQLFASQGHSGFSAPYCVEMFRTLASWKPWGPLTGEESEWVEVADGVFQNRRCSRVFRENGEAYDIDGRVFEDENGSRWTSRDSRVPVVFPYSPKTEIVFRRSDAGGEE